MSLSQSSIMERPNSIVGRRDLGVTMNKRGSMMNKERYPTVRWNNLLALGLGIPALAYAVVVLTTSVLSDVAGFIGLVVIGVLY